MIKNVGLLIFPQQNNTQFHVILGAFSIHLQKCTQLQEIWVLLQPFSGTSGYTNQSIFKKLKINILCTIYIYFQLQLYTIIFLSRKKIMVLHLYISPTRRWCFIVVLLLCYPTWVLFTLQHCFKSTHPIQCLFVFSV